MFTECLVGNVIRIKDARNKVQLVVLEGALTINFAFGKSLALRET